MMMNLRDSPKFSFRTLEDQSPDELEDCLDVEQKTMGYSMSKLASLNWCEDNSELELDTTANFCPISNANPRPISWQDVEKSSDKD